MTRDDSITQFLMIDSHCHLTDPRLFEQLEAVLSRALVAGVRRMITVGTNPADDAGGPAVCRGREDPRGPVGRHPNYCHDVDAAQGPALPRRQRRPSCLDTR